VNQLVWRVVGADDARDDLVQQVFVALLKGRQGVRDPEALAGWVAMVTLNTLPPSSGGYSWRGRASTGWPR
jgi:DNA-directed RNA polymerase specialized sigma24 family protein